MINTRPPKRPSLDRTLMGIAALMSERSTCNRAQVGAVIALNGRPITTGFNGAPAGMPHCSNTPNHLELPHCTNAVHAESNAIAFAAANGVATRGATLYTTLAPCLPCAQLVINAGIIRVVALQPHVSDRAGWNLLQSVEPYGIPMDLEMWEK